MSWQTIVKENNLEIASVLFSELNKETRLDAEYYRPEALLYLEHLQQKKAVPISSLAKFVVGPFGSTVTVDMYVDDEEYSYVRNQDIGSFEIHTSDAHIPKELFEKLKQFHIKEDDLLVTVVGTLGKVAVAQPKDTKSIFSCKSTIIRCTGVDPYYLATFLNSKIGQMLLLRCKRGAIQEGLNLFDIKTLNVAVPSTQFQTQIRDGIKKVFTLSKKAEMCYSEAEQVLLKEINLKGHSGTDEVISVRNFSEALADNRFDAEYWQPDYDVIFDTLSKYKKGVSTIGDEFKQLKGNFKAEKDKEYNYVEIGDVNVSTGEVEHNSIIGAELPANAKIKFGKRQLITSKVRPNRGATAILDNHEGYIGSGAFTVLTEQDNINLETLMVYLKARPIRELLLRYNTGTSYPVITDADVLKLPIPLIDKTLQKKISELVSVSATERQQAKELLEKAKRAVEIFVEKDESHALRYIAA
jgi:type I restriction enzyme S subunit